MIVFAFPVVMANCDINYLDLGQGAVHEGDGKNPVSITSLPAERGSRRRRDRSPDGCIYSGKGIFQFFVNVYCHPEIWVVYICVRSKTPDEKEERMKAETAGG